MRKIQGAIRNPEVIQIPTFHWSGIISSVIRANCRGLGDCADRACRRHRRLAYIYLIYVVVLPVSLFRWTASI